MLSLKANNIHKYYPRRGKVIKGFSHSFDAPGLYLITGPNGSGKSTLLRILSLLEPPDSGEVIYYEGKLPQKQNLKLMRRLTMMLPSGGVFDRSVFENVAYGLRARGKEKHILRDKTLSALDKVGLLDYMAVRAMSLSSGETRRMLLARALAIEPEVLLLDEPTAHVDSKNQRIIQNIVSGLADERKITLIMATHEPDLHPYALKLISVPHIA